MYANVEANGRSSKTACADSNGFVAVSKATGAAD
jgi:hypothetical protein